ncbi:MAG: hypothetical protein ACLGIN_07965 [Candidatus Sericytochromatia bacterium]
MRTPLLPVLGLASMILLAACGQTDPVRTLPARDTRPIPVEPTFPIGGPPQPQAPAFNPQVQQMVAAAVQRLDAIKTIEGKVRFEEWKGDQQDIGEAQFTFRQRPFAARVDVLSSNRMLVSGTSILWEGGTSLKVKPVGLPLTMNFAYDHSQVVSLRGYRMDQTDLFSMGKVLRAPGAQIRPLGPRKVRGEEVFILEVRSPGSLPDVSHELIGLHTRHQIPTYREMYAGSKLIHRGQGLNLRFDGSLDGEAFDL